MLSRSHQVMKFQEFSIEFQLNSTLKRFSEFLFKIHWESGDVSIRKVVP
jgi:hypothetical protein